MKKSIIILLAATAMTFNGCKEADFLDIKPQGVLSSGVIDPDLLVTAAYQALAGPRSQEWEAWWSPTTNWIYGEVRSDNALKGGGDTGDGGDVHLIERFQTNASTGNLDVKWFRLYCSVQRCNSAISALKNVSDSKYPKRDIRIAEMKMLRAHFFFELSRMYNKIVYFDENVDIDEYPSLGNDKYSRDEILEMIALELHEAAEVLPSEQPEMGRVNKWAAKAYEAKVKLYRAYKQDDRTHAVISIDDDLLQEVVNLCDEVLPHYDLLSDFQQLDLVAYEHGPESIFSVEYSMNDGTVDAGRINWSNLLNSPQGPYGGDGFFLPSHNLVNAYQTDANGLPLFDNFDKHDYDVEVEIKDASGKVTGYEYTNREGTVDPRLDFIVGRPNIRWKTYQEAPCSRTWVRNRDIYGYFCTKRFFVSPDSPDMYNAWPWGASQLNWRIIRKADVMLWKAEALIEMNKNLGEARELINAIRRRAKASAYVKDFEDESKNAANYLIGEYPETGWTQSYAREALRFETRLEKALEGERFFDLVRWGIAAKVMNRFIETEKKFRIYYDNASVKFTEKRDEYFPISYAQYNFSGGLYTQNPEYGEF